MASGTSGSVLASLTYGYDENSNPTSMTDQGGNQSTFSCNALDRLTQEAHPEKTLSYGYDPAGNRKTKADGTTTTSYAFDAAERMIGAGSETFAHDNNGNLSGRRLGSWRGKISGAQ